MKEKLKDLDFRLTELSSYLSVSRPTLYKYIESFILKQYKDIDNESLAVLKFINQKTTVSKLQVIDYIIKRKSSATEINPLLLKKIREVVNSREKEDLMFDLIDIFESENYASLITEIIKQYRGK